MALNLTKLNTFTGVQYLLNSIVEDDGKPITGKLAQYYSQQGNNPGVWLGAGLTGLNIEAGTTATKMEATLLYSAFLNPRTGEPLGQYAKLNDPHQVSGYDLTFRIPKSISLTWALADAPTRAAIEKCHDDAVAMTLNWLEDNVFHTRSGRDGVWSSPINGVVAIAYKHFESRAGDPHLHTHLTISNRAQRAYDGKWLTLDGTSLYRAAVTGSEVHENSLLDLLHQRLGLVFEERERATTSTKSVVLDIVGIPTDLIERFSQRRLETREKYEQLLAEWQADNPGLSPSLRLRNSLDAKAWAETRQPKPRDTPPPLQELVAKWRQQAQQLGYTWAILRRRVLGHDSESIDAEYVAAQPDTVKKLAAIVIAHAHQHQGLTTPKGDAEEYYDYVPGTLKDWLSNVAETEVSDYLNTHNQNQIMSGVAQVITENLPTARSAWSPSNVRAEVERVTRLIRCQPGERENLMTAITDAVLDQSIPLTPMRYQLPNLDPDDPRFMYHGQLGSENPDQRIYTSQTILNAEAFLNSLTEQPVSNAVQNDKANALLADWQQHRPGDKLSPDQFAAAHHIVTAPVTLTALVGPAGTGKTRTMKAVKYLWETEHGSGTVLGVGPSARAARELSQVGINARTIDKLLVANTPAERAKRAEWHQILSNRLLTAQTPRQITATLKLLEKSVTEAANVTITANTLLIVDEASMATTHHLTALGRLCDAVGAKMILTGDPQQLNSVGAGGILGWLDRQGKTKHLTELHRFKNEWERKASLRLRAGDASVLYPAAVETKSVETIAYAITRDRPEQFGHDPEKILAEATRLHHVQGEDTYADYGRIHDGDESKMLEDAYQAVKKAQQEWVEETHPITGEITRRRKTAVLIAAGNIDVFDLNQRATADRRANGEVDNKVTIGLRGGADAGIGEIISARKNNRAGGIKQPLILDEFGVPIENGNLLVVRRFNYAKNAKDIISVTCTRYDEQGAKVTIPYKYMAKHVDLGYAVTAHRAQGLTVDVAHLFVPWLARLSRKVLYVAMTRGQYENHVYQSTPTVDDLHHEHKKQFTPNASGEMVEQTILGADVLAAMVKTPDDELTAHEQAEAEQHKKATLHRLIAEHDHTAGLATGPWLHKYLTERHGKDIADKTMSEEGWEALVTSFRTCFFTDPERARRVVGFILPTPIDPTNLAAAETETETDRTKHIRQLRLKVTTAQQEVNRLQEPGAAAKAIEQAKTRVERKRRKSDEYEAYWQQKHPDEQLPAGQGNNVPLTVRRHRYAAADAEAHLKEVTAPGWQAKASQEAAQKLADAKTALQTAAPEYSAILRKRLARAMENWAQHRITDPRAIGGVIYPIHSTDPATKAIAAAQENKIREVISNLATAIQAERLPAWARGLPTRPDITDDRYEQWVQMAHATAIYRESWNITATNSLLGVEPKPGRQYLLYHQVADLITEYQNPGRPKRRPPQPEPLPPWEHPDYDWTTHANYPRLVESTDGELHFDNGPDPTIPQNSWPTAEYYPDDEGWLSDGEMFEDGYYPDEPYFGDERWEPNDDPFDGEYREDRADELVGFVADAATSPTWQTPPKQQRDVTQENPDEDYLNHLANINAAAYAFWQTRAQSSWVPNYLAERGIADVTPPAYAPGGSQNWRQTLHHLRRLGYAETDIIAAGLAVQPANNGSPYDRFRDRLPFPIYDHAGRLAGFTARKNPADTDDNNPKYLNTSKNDLYVKNQLLYGLNTDARAQLAAGATPVLVEGPFDAAAITAAAQQTGANIVPLATCGTAVTANQIGLIASHRPDGIKNLVVALDQDSAGQEATAKLFHTIGPREAGTITTPHWAGRKDPGEFAATRDYATLIGHLTASDSQTPLAAVWAQQELATVKNPDQAFAHTLLAAAVVTRDPESLAAVQNVLLDHGYTGLETVVARMQAEYAIGTSIPRDIAPDARDEAWLAGEPLTPPDESEDYATVESSDADIDF